MPHKTNLREKVLLSICMALAMLVVLVVSAIHAYQAPVIKEAPPASILPREVLVHAKSSVDFDSLDPARANELNGNQLILQIYDQLITLKREKTEQFVPMLASAWEISEAGTRYTFTIRPGVKFQNGNPLTAEDVAYTFQRGILQGGTASPQWLFTEAIFGRGVYDVCAILDEATCDSRSLLQARQRVYPAQVAGVCQRLKTAIQADEAQGRVTFTLQQAWGPLLASLVGPWGSVIDKEWSIAHGTWDGDCATWQDYYAVDEQGDTPLRYIANGSGPFQVVQWTRGVEVVLTRHPGYWVEQPLWAGGPTGAASLASVILTQQEYAPDRTQMLLNGSADLADADPQGLAALEAQVALIYAQPDGLTPVLHNPAGLLKLYTSGLANYSLDMGFNFAIAADGAHNFIGSGRLDGLGVPADFFSDVQVRKGFNYAFDWQEYIARALSGSGIQRSGPILKGLSGYYDAQPKYVHDERLALTQLYQAWGGALLEHGFTLRLPYTSDHPDQRIFLEILQANLQALDARFHITLSELTPAAFAELQDSAYLPLIAINRVQNIPHPHNWVQPYLVGYYARQQHLPQELVERYRSLIDACVLLAGDAARVCYEWIQTSASDDAPGIYLAQSYVMDMLRLEVQGFYQNPALPTRYYALSKSATPVIAHLSPTSELNLTFRDSAHTTFQLYLPAGGVAGAYTLLVTPDRAVNGGAWGSALVETGFSLQAFESGGALAPLTFSTPLNINIAYDPQRLGSLDERKLSLFLWVGTAWVEAACGEYGRDVQHNRLQARVCQTGEFALGER